MTKIDERIFSEGELTVYFAGEGLLTAEVVAESLSGWSGIYKRVPAILAQHHPAFRHIRLVLFIEAIDHGSMTARIIARLLTKSPEDAARMENDIEAITDLAKQAFLDNIHRMNPAGKTLLTAAAGGALMYGALNLGGYLEKDARTAIHDVSGVVFNQSAVYFSTTPAEFVQMLDRATPDNARLTRQAISALRPAGSLSDGSVRLGDEGSNLVVSSSAAKIVSNVRAEDLKPRIETRRLQRTAISIRAMDLDRKKSGWAAVIPDVSTNRVRLTIMDRVKINAPGTYLADLDVDVAIDLDGNETPKRATVIGIHP